MNITDARLLGSLYDTIEANPSSVGARSILLSTLVAQGLNDAATSIANDILQLDPLNQEAQSCLSNSNGEERRTTESAGVLYTTAFTQQSTEFDTVESNTARSEITQKASLETEFTNQLREVTGLANILVDPYYIKRYSIIDHQKASHARDAANIASGRLENILSPRPKAVREVAREMAQVDKVRAMEIIVEDLRMASEWIRKTGGTDPRSRLVKRRQALEAALPLDMEKVVAEAFMHVEHEVLGKSYVNNETMLGDAIPDIGRSNFLATEDGYAWDMDELAQAITSNGGVMRNPLSKDLFSPEDVSKILAHSLGVKLRPMQLEQVSLKKGVRQNTIENIYNLSNVLLADITEDAAESRKAVDEFLVFVATLPYYEQMVLDELKVPGRDTHTGQAFDYTVGESVRDAKGNKTCFHKVGDFLAQASVWLG